MVTERLKRLLGRGQFDDVAAAEREKFQDAQTEARRERAEMEAREQARREARQEVLEERRERAAELERRKERARQRRGGGATGALAAGKEELLAKAGGGDGGDGSLVEKGLSAFDRAVAVDTDGDGQADRVVAPPAEPAPEPPATDAGMDTPEINLTIETLEVKADDGSGMPEPTQPDDADAFVGDRDDDTSVVGDDFRIF